MHPLLAEDEDALADWLVRALWQSDFVVDWVDDGRLVAGQLQATRHDALIRHTGEPLSKQEILERLCADEQAVRPEVGEVLVQCLRRRLESGAFRISTRRTLLSLVLLIMPRMVSVESSLTWKTGLRAANAA